MMRQRQEEIVEMRAPTNILECVEERALDLRNGIRAASLVRMPCSA
jgi:hypothetical protein